MPKLGLTMTEGMVSKWEIAEGQRFAAGDIVVVIESEKTAFDVEAPAAGTLQKVLVGESETVPVGTLLAHWQLDGGEVVSQPVTQQERSAEAAAPASNRAESPPTVAAPTSGAHAQQHSGRRLATPLARRLAHEAKANLDSIIGSGPRSRIQAADVKAVLTVSAKLPQSRSAGRPEAMPAPGAVAASDRPPGNLLPPSGIERTMAARVTAAKRDIPHFYLAVDIDVGPLMAMRASLNRVNSERRVSMSHLFIAAVVHSLRAVPRMNAVWTEEGILSYDRIDVGIAVDTKRGLMSPVVRDLGGDSLYGLVSKIDDVIDRARHGALGPDDQKGGAISVSNAGMHHVHYMTSIIVPGQSSILGIGAVQDCFRPDASGVPTLRRELGVVLSADHRVHTGVGALAFLEALERALAEPLHFLTYHQ